MTDLSKCRREKDADLRAEMVFIVISSRLLDG
jgi:hypothetical protein